MDSFDFGFGGPRLPFSGITASHAAVARAYGDLLNSVALPVVVLNNYWQIVFANRDFLRLFPVGKEDDILGQRIGEVLGCSNSSLSVSGCGTSPGCRVCDLGGALYAALFDDLDSGTRAVRTGAGSALERAELACRFFSMGEDMMRVCTFVNVGLRDAAEAQHAGEYAPSQEM